MKRLALDTAGRIGARLPRPLRRFLLDRLRLGRLLDRVARDEFDEVELPNGATLAINRLMHAHVANEGKVVYEDDVLRAIEENLAPGDVFYDVGANIGVFAFTAASHVGATGAVHAFEPEENNLACFRRSLAQVDSPIIVLHEIAVGAADGTMTFDRRGGAFSGRLVADAAEAKGASVEVAVRAIDSLVADGTPPPTLVKIDVEGGEGDVLEGMRETLKTHGPAILCELHLFNPDGVRRALDVLEGAAYVCRGLDGERLTSKAALDGASPDLPRHVLARPA